MICQTRVSRLLVHSSIIRGNRFDRKDRKFFKGKAPIEESRATTFSETHTENQGKNRATTEGMLRNETISLTLIE